MQIILGTRLNRQWFFRHDIKVMINAYEITSYIVEVRTEWMFIMSHNTLKPQKLIDLERAEGNTQELASRQKEMFINISCCNVIELIVARHAGGPCSSNSNPTRSQKKNL